ncbi:hypothetical protein DPMN_125783 [Dreissena polymorpha]|uniref:Uncharacterized protein n=1 Tax=Dreissena polymorpha TaxID=45954 RepID=A0A9D4GVX3_DREPO|nr:hypothetical protein DPMN_125783 [Dreissena polymorpha]
MATQTVQETLKSTGRSTLAEGGSKQSSRASNYVGTGIAVFIEARMVWGLSHMYERRQDG